MKYESINIFGLGNIGLNISNLIVYEGLANTVNLVSNQKDNVLQAVKLDLINHVPYTKENTKVEIFNQNNFIDAEINIVCGGFKQKPNQKRIELLQENEKWLDNIINQNLKGHWIVITNPDDYMAKYLLNNSNLSENDISCLGISLDSMRAKSKGIFSTLKGQHNKNLTTSENKSLEEITKIPFQIIKDKGFTCYGIGFVLMWFLKKELMNKETMLSKYNLNNKQFEAVKN